MFKVLLIISIAFAQIEEFQAKQPHVITGQLFTVRVVPAARNMQVYVIGNQVADVSLQKTQLSATFKMGSRTWHVEPERKNDHFSITAPADLPVGTQPQLKLKIKAGEKSESFDLKIDNTKK